VVAHRQRLKSPFPHHKQSQLVRVAQVLVQEPLAGTGQIQFLARLLQPAAVAAAAVISMAQLVVLVAAQNSENHLVAVLQIKVMQAEQAPMFLKRLVPLVVVVELLLLVVTAFLVFRLALVAMAFRLRLLGR
jgi:hypothetical protein